MDIDSYKYRLPRPNYLRHNIQDKDDEIVEEYIPLDRPVDFDNATYFNKVKRAAQNFGITKPKGHVVSFHSNPEMEKYHFGQTHPMKPWRLTLSNSLIMSYGMTFAMDNYTSRAATYEELHTFHSSDYLDFLGTVLPEPIPRDVENQNPDLKFNLGGSDCPLFEGVYDYCSYSAGEAPRRCPQALQTSSPTSPSPGAVVCTMPRRPRLRASATSTTLSSPSCSSCAATRACCTSTSMCTTEMVSRRPSSRRTES